MDAIETILALPMPEAEDAVRRALTDQGFGVLTEIDVAATLKAKLGVDRSPLKILGACNPEFAHRALELDPSASLLLPCNVVLTAEGDRTRVAIVDPRTLITGPDMEALAEAAAARLLAARDALAASN